MPVVHFHDGMMVSSGLVSWRALRGLYRHRPGLEHNFDVIAKVHASPKARWCRILGHQRSGNTTPPTPKPQRKKPAPLNRSSTILDISNIASNQAKSASRQSSELLCAKRHFNEAPRLLRRNAVVSRARSALFIFPSRPGRDPFARFPSSPHASTSQLLAQDRRGAKMRLRDRVRYQQTSDRQLHGSSLNIPQHACAIS